MSGSSTRRRAGKRARVEEPAAPASSSPPAAAAPTIDTLPDAVMSDIFKVLGPRASWPLRGVCRRWRGLIQGTEWTWFELGAPVKRKPGTAASSSRAYGKTRKQAGRADGEQAYSAVAALFDRRVRKLRLAAGATVVLRPELAEFGGVRAARQGHRRTVAAACSLLAAITRSHSGPAQPGHVIVELRGVDELFSFRGESDECFLEAYVLGVLRALRPPDGSASALEGLSIGFTCDSSDSDMSDERMAWPEAAGLRAALTPFGRLRALDLFARNSFGLMPDDAAALAAACPLLKTLLLVPSFDYAPRVLAALAPLAHLEELAVAWPSEEVAQSSGVGGGLAALAGGPAGKSLARLVFFEEAALFRGPGGEFPLPSSSSGLPDLAYAPLASADLLALGRMPRLELFLPLFFDPDAVEPEAVRALGGMAGLRQAVLWVVHGSDAARAAAALRALGEALSDLPSGPGLEIGLILQMWGHPTSSEMVAGLLGSPGARRALTALNLNLRRPLEEADAEAVLALPALQRLELSCALEPPASPESLRPFEVLARLRPEVAVAVRLGPDRDRGAGRAELEGAALRAAEAEVRRLFAGGRDSRRVS
eukprot:tig00001177_g7376.t1